MTTAGDATGGVPAVTAPRDATGASQAAETARGTAGAADSPGRPVPSRRARIEGLLLGLAAGDAA
ncbi:ADP-ribosylglycohydrolase family protein, partial [Streptomyces anulatus]|nr:ADP-ribosylglycohydrolase family protein [Streptomyces anulatus]